MRNIDDDVLDEGCLALRQGLAFRKPMLKRKFDRFLSVGERLHLALAIGDDLGQGRDAHGETALGLRAQRDVVAVFLTHGDGLLHMGLRVLPSARLSNKQAGCAAYTEPSYGLGVKEGVHLLVGNELAAIGLGNAFRDGGVLLG